MTNALFDAEFLAELQDLAAATDRLQPPLVALSAHLDLQAFLAPVPGKATPLSEEDFVALPAAELTARTDALLQIARRSSDRDAAAAVDSFVVFFQALLPGLTPDGAEQVRRLFFRLVSTLLHLCHAGFGGKREEGRRALGQLETILIEVSSVRLTPAESELVARTLEPLAGFVAAGEYALASEVVSSQLLAILEKNRVTRNLYRLMGIEATVQLYLKDRLGHSTPQLRVPGDFGALRAYGPIRIIDESDASGPRRLVQVQLPDIPMPRHVVLHLVPRGGGEPHDLRFDLLGCAVLAVPPGHYDFGLLYQP
ncbi:MAG TPA: hypothetical protein VFM88_12985 [Vicinamibacteria bacterium]|nr:hypothetical protein [Vicinamibacteria bacterium]